MVNLFPSHLMVDFARCVYFFVSDDDCKGGRLSALV